MKKKLLSFVLVAAMLVSMVVFAPSAGAETVATVATTNAVGFAGDTVTVEVQITADYFASFQLAFVYDSSRLTYEGVQYSQTGSSFAPAGAAQNQQFVQNGPYTLIGRAWQTEDGKSFVFEECDSMTFATLTFSINEGAAAGDAYVQFCSLTGEYNDEAYTYDKVVRSAELGIFDQINYVGSNVTVLPEGYGAAINVPEDAWDFEDGVIYGIVDESIADATGALVVPSQIGGVDVIEIGAAAFDGYSFSTIVLPETVEFVAAGAVYNCTNLKKAYVLGADTELEEAAIGYEGSWRSGKLRNPAIILDENDSVLTSIYGVAGSLAQAYAEAGDGVDVFPFYAEGVNSITFNGATYLVGSTVAAPGMALIDGQTVVAWTDGTNTYAAGETIALNGALVLEPVTITAPVTSTAVDFKVTANEADLAMRFTAMLSIADYNVLASLGTVELGMLITPAAYVAKAASFTKEALDALGAENGAYVDIAIDGYYNVTADKYIFAGSLMGFSAKTLAKNPNFAAILYATVTTEDGTVFTVYGDFNFDANQNVKTVATNLSTSSALTDTQKGWLVALADKFTK